MEINIDFNYETKQEVLDYVYQSIDPNIIDRYKRFLALSPLGKNLIIYLYNKDLKKYLDSFSHPLEDYIVEFDKILDSEDLVLALSSRIGILISDDAEFSPREIFIDRIVSYIKHVVHNNDNKIAIDKFPSTEEIIEMSKEEFKEYSKIYGIEYSYLNYLDRMDFFTDIYRSKLMPDE